jgi:ABC-type transport system involved in cytochrome c biogenesis permease subunit
MWEKVCNVICWITMVAGALLGTIGITIRSLIMERPPITTLYETIIFITTAAVIGALLVEWLSRRKGLAMTIACIAGAAGMFLSIRFFEMEGKDSLVQLQAVLITNFWLATHVPCINLGYACGMVACICSMVYFTRRVLGVTKAGDEDARTLSRIAYAFVLAGLFLSLVGTVLGGIWANYSWGRFWGWDPKENGALMIVLMNLIILHARLGGYIREAGFHVSCMVLGMVTIFSWFATNQLGIGLHAYGELSGARLWLYITWGTMAGYVILGIILARLDKNSRSGGGITGASTRGDETSGRALHPQAAAKS